MLKTKLFVFDSTLALCLCSAWGCLISSHIWEPSSSWQQTSKCLPEGTRGFRELLGRQPQYPSSELKGGASICYEKVCEEELPPQCTETINLKNNLPWKGGQVRYPLISFNDAYWAPTTARMAGPQSTGELKFLGGKTTRTSEWLRESQQVQGSGRVGEIYLLLISWRSQEPTPVQTHVQGGRSEAG